MAIKSEREKLREAIADNLYWEMCRDCPNAKKCHEDCGECDEFVNELYKQYKAHNVNEPEEEPEEEGLPVGWKSYIDEKGSMYFYKTREMLCGMLTHCTDCPNWGKCYKNKEQNSCDRYNEKLEELKTKGIK